MTLVLLAAGMGSRYGGLKQLDPVGPHGEVLLDYSIHDAVQAGFSKIVFVIRKEIAAAFQEHITQRYATLYPDLELRFVFQELEDLPKKSVSNSSLKISERSKPWGTGHALWAARHEVNTPFAVINADDYYGPSGYRLLKKFFETTSHDHVYAMVAYALKNTLSEHGSVSRGVCQADVKDFLQDVTERTSIRKTAHGIIAEEKKETLSFTGEEWVSLNFWGFTPTIFPHLEKGFADFLNDKKNHVAAEFYLPALVNKLIHENSASVQLLPSNDPWFGLTHPADLAMVKKALSSIPLHQKIL